MQWFDVDKVGLAKLLARRGKEFIVYELIQNAWDEDTKIVNVSLTRIAGTRNAKLIVEDDNPNGFADLSHAFTLFADSTKKKDASKRGRFNLGEKLVLALCDEAEISSTTGTIIFDKTGRHTKRTKREHGSVFTGTIKMTQEEIDHCAKVVYELLPPSSIVTVFNGTTIPPRESIATTIATLPTEEADAEGYLRRTARKTDIEVYEVQEGETAKLYELGIPVVETGDRFHVNVLQKIPLTVERDNVPPSYLALVRSVVLEITHHRLSTEDANATWIKDAVHRHGDTMANETIEHLTSLRFGDKRVSYDPSDIEANKLAVSQGYRVVHGGQLSGPEWDAIRRVGAILPAGQVTPSPKPFSPDGKPLNYVPEDKWTPAIKSVVGYVRRVSTKLVGMQISVRIASDVAWPFSAVYGKGDLIFNLGRLGHAWFSGPLAEINRLVIHELGHHYSGDHLSSEYHDALCKLGARLSQIALDEPELFHLGER